MMSGFLGLFQPSLFHTIYVTVYWAQKHLRGARGSVEQNCGPKKLCNETPVGLNFCSSDYYLCEPGQVI